MKAIVLDEVPQDEEIILGWNKLVFRMERPEVFFTYQWALAASSAFCGRVRPRIFLIYEGTELSGVAALATSIESEDRAFFLSASTADYCDIVSVPERRAEVLGTMLEEMHKLGIRDLTLANVPAESQTLKYLRASGGVHALRLHERPGYDCRVIALGDATQRQHVLQAVVRKEKEKRGLKKLAERGPVEVRDLRPSELATGLQPLFAAHISRFLATNRPSPLLQRERRFFLAELARLLDAQNWLKVSQLVVNERPIAWNYGFKFLDSWFWYLPTFEMKYEEFSPGSSLLRLLTEEACADPAVQRLDLGLGDEPYKDRFCNSFYSTRYVQLSRSMPRHVLNVGRHWLTTSAARVPAVEEKLRAGRDRLIGVQRRVEKTGVAATVWHGLSRAKHRALSKDEVAIFEAPLEASPMADRENERVSGRPVTLDLLTWSDLAQTAVDNADEPTLQYLVRCAQRLRQGKLEGYCLHGPAGKVLHFLWIDSYNGFHLSEIDSRLESGDPNAAMIFDCWTPAAYRGHAYYATAIRMAAANLQKQQRQAWIFGGASNQSSLSGIRKAGFLYRFSLVQRRSFGKTTISRQITESPVCMVERKQVEPKVEVRKSG